MLSDPRGVLLALVVVFVPALARGLAEPGSCGLGGQTCILVRMSDGRAVAVDGSARSPLRASAEELARMRDPIPAGKFLAGYKSVATPGDLAGLTLALRTFGTLTLADAVAPSIEIAEFGSACSASLHAFSENYSTEVRASRVSTSCPLRTHQQLAGLLLPAQRVTALLGFAGLGHHGLLLPS